MNTDLILICVHLWLNEESVHALLEESKAVPYSPDIPGSHRLRPRGRRAGVAAQSEPAPRRRPGPAVHGSLAGRRQSATPARQGKARHLADHGRWAVAPRNV